jgi:hypothetical protein
MRSIVTVTTAATDINLTTLDNLKLELGITDTDSDDQLELWIAQASAVAARYCNRVLAVETVTETFRNAGSYPYEWFYRCGEGRSFDGITLTRYPIVSIASVTVDGTVLDTSEYEHDETEVYRLSTAGYPTRWWFGKSIVVSYVAGYTIPVTAAYADLERAVIAMIRDFRAVTLREDPNLKRRRTDGVSELEWWVPTASTRMLPIEISGMLDPFVRKWGWMS